MISPLAYVDPAAKIGNNVEIKPFAYIEGDVEIGDDCIIMPYVSIMNGSKIGKGNVIYQNTVIGSEPQDMHYEPGTPSHVVIGDYNHIRENVVIAGSIYADRATTIGSHNHLMNKVHICHDVCVGNHVVLGISVSVAGESEIHDWSILSSAVVVQQKVRVGRFALVQSGSRLQKDISPYAIFGGNPAAYHGINSTVFRSVAVGVTDELLLNIANAYRMITAGNFSLEDAVIKIKEQIPPSREIDEISKFIQTTKLGIVRNYVKEN